MSKVFFNLENGGVCSTGKGVECWMADGNLWFSTLGLEASVNSIPLEQFCDFLDKGSQTEDYIDMEIDGILFALEENDEGIRNLVFSGKVFLAVVVHTAHLPAFSKFMRLHLSNDGQTLDSVNI